MFVNRYPWSHLILQIEFLSRKQKVKGHNSKIMIVLILVINEDKCNENVFFKLIISKNLNKMIFTIPLKFIDPDI